MLAKAKVRLQEGKAAVVTIWLLWLLEDMLGMVKIWDIILEVIIIWSVTSE